MPPDHWAFTPHLLDRKLHRSPSRPAAEGRDLLHSTNDLRMAVPVRRPGPGRLMEWAGKEAMRFLPSEERCNENNRSWKDRHIGRRGVLSIQDPRVSIDGGFDGICECSTVDD